MDNTVLVSIVIPAYNCEATILELLDCIEQQRLSHYEVIVVNDGSKDRTLELLTERSRTMTCLRVFDKENEGAPKARNLGLSHVKGEYVYLCDADDLIPAGALSKMVDYAIKNQLDVVVGNLRNVNGKGEEHIYKAVADRHMNMGVDRYYFCDPIPGTKLFRTAFLREQGILFDNVKVGQDLNFFLKAVCSTEKIGWLDEIVYMYRTSFSGISKTYKLENLLDIRRSVGGAIEYCRQKGLYTGDRENALECVKLGNYMWQLRKKKNVKKEDYAILRKELCGEVDLKKVKGSKFRSVTKIGRMEFFLVKNFNVILRGI